MYTYFTILNMLNLEWSGKAEVLNVNVKILGNDSCTQNDSFAGALLTIRACDRWQYQLATPSSLVIAASSIYGYHFE